MNRMITVEHVDENDNPIMINLSYGDAEDDPEDLDKETILAILLLDGQIVLGDFNWNDDFTDPEREMICVEAICNDVFAWGCADSVPVDYRELTDLFMYYLKDRSDGVTVWCIKKRNMMPQKPVYDAIGTSGIWDLDNMELEPNPTWSWAEFGYDDQ